MEVHLNTQGGCFWNDLIVSYSHFSEKKEESALFEGEVEI